MVQPHLVQGRRLGGVADRNLRRRHRDHPHQPLAGYRGVGFGAHYGGLACPRHGARPREVSGLLAWLGGWLGLAWGVTWLGLRWLELAWLGVALTWLSTVVNAVVDAAVHVSLPLSLTLTLRFTLYLVVRLVVRCHARCR